MRFCGTCGAALRDDVPQAELRQLTVLFCDLVGSTALAETIEPEDFREITTAYHRACSEAIDQYEGHVAQYLGDGLLVYFGYPAAHEDDARRAVCTALGIIDGLKALNARLEADRSVELAARIGIHTGPVVVGEMGGREHRENLALGNTPNLAARAQSVALPGTIVVSDATYRITRGFFEFLPLGAHELKGLSEPVILHRVLRDTGASGRIDAAQRGGLTKLVGRAEELRTLDDRWHSVGASGTSHTVLVAGEAGIGKSRIVTTLRDRVKGRSTTVLECFCSPYYQNSALFPVIAMVERALGFTRETSSSDKRQALESRLARRGLLTGETFAMMCQLLSIPLETGQQPSDLSPQVQRERTLQTLLAWLVAITQDGAVLWIVEDLHWADPTTLEFVRAVVAGSAAAPILSVLTFRPEFDSPWPDGEHVTSVALGRLDSVDASAMVARVANDKPLPPDVLKQLLQRTEGVPLFLEELTKAVLELGVLDERDDRYEINGPLPPNLIPATVQGSLIARLDRTGSAKPIAQIAAAIGREFRFDVLSAVASVDEPTLRRALDRLLNAEILYRIGEPPDETYLFKHALIQDAAYQSVLKKSRRGLHGRIADALMDRFPVVANQRPELLAEHFYLAGRGPEAVQNWLRAGQLALVRAANHEAIAHLKRGLELLRDLPGVAAPEQELEFLVALAPAITQTKGYVAPELDRVFRRAGELVAQLGATPHQLPVLSMTFAFHFVAGRVKQSLELSAEVLRVATAIGNPALISVGQGNSCVAHLYHGDMRAAVEHARAQIALFNLDSEHWVMRMWGQSITVCTYCYLSEALWMLGYPEQALAASDKSLELAQQLGHVPSLSFALSYKAEFYHLLRDVPRVLSVADESIRLGRAERFDFWEPVVMVFKGWALTAESKLEDGIALMREGLTRYRAAGNGITQGRMLAVLAEAVWSSDRRDEALALLDEGMMLAASNEEGFYEPELYRLRGEFLGRQALESAGSPGDRTDALTRARESVNTALTMAQRQQARALELRAAMTLCKFPRDDADAGADIARLDSVYGQFTEGFSLPDLREARALLDRARA